VRGGSGLCHGLLFSCLGGLLDRVSLPQLTIQGSQESVPPGVASLPRQWHGRRAFGGAYERTHERTQPSQDEWQLEPYRSNIYTIICQWVS
jgi:hypothetical protein